MSDTRDALRCYFGFRSPYSRLGLHKLAGVDFGGRLIAFTGPPEDAGGFADPAANRYKRDYIVQDVLRVTAAMGLPLALPDPFDVDWAPANRAFQAADRAGRGMAFALAVSDARWGEGRDISDPAVLADCAAAAGLPAPDVEALAADPDIRARFRADRELICADGVFGVPFLVDGAEKYWGQDRFDLWIALRGG